MARTQHNLKARRRHTA